MIMKVFDVPEEEADEILAEIAAESQPALSVNDNLMYGQANGDDE